MKKKFKLGVIGCGFMGSALVKGVVLSDFLSPKKVIASDLVAANLDSVADTGVYTCNSNRFVAENSEYLVLAVKPQHFENVVKSLGGYKPENVISVMAGVSKLFIKKKFGSDKIRVAICMPNLPCSIGSGAIASDMSDFDGNTDDSDFIFNVFDSVGMVLSIDESNMDAVTGISVSGPAYAFMLIDAMIDAGIKHGLSKDAAKALAVQTVLGAAEMVQRDERSVPDLIMQACGKGGVALEAVKVLEENNFRGTVYQAVAACVNKSRELSE